MKVLKNFFSNIGEKMIEFDLFTGDTLENICDNISQGITDAIDFIWIVIKTLFVLFLYILFFPVTIILIIMFIFKKKNESEDDNNG